MNDPAYQNPQHIEALRQKVSAPIGQATSVPADPYAVTAWGHSSVVTRDLVLPSGQRCLIKQLEMQDVLRLDIMDVIDTFTGSLLSSSEKKRKKGKVEEEGADVVRLLADPENFTKMNDAVNKIVVASVLKPQIHPIYPNDQTWFRKDGLIYVDSIAFNDRMEIFNASFESLGDMTPFRDEQASGLGAMAPEQGSSPSA